MFWLGKIFGAFFGFIVAGPFGLVLGILLGHYFDVSLKGFNLSPPPGTGNHTSAQDVFFKATFTIMGYIAKADGRVSENEIRAATTIMKNMFLNAHLKQQAMDYFRQGKLANFNLDQILSLLSNACYHQQNLLHLFLDIQLQAAFADGNLTRNKQRILEHICYRLNLNPGDFFQSRSYQYNQGSRSQRPPEPNSLEKAYRLLGVNAATSDGDLKKAYRKLMSQNHPDKLVSKGLPEEMIKLATQKTQEIKAAYETICKARGI